MVSLLLISPCCTVALLAKSAPMGGPVEIRSGGLEGVLTNELRHTPYLTFKVAMEAVGGATTVFMLLLQ